MNRKCSCVQLECNYCYYCSDTAVKQQTVSDASVMNISDVCLPFSRSEHLSRGNLSAVIYGVGNLEHCRRKMLPLLRICKKGGSSMPTTNCTASDFQCPSVSFINGKFYAFSEFYYTMEDILRIGGKYNSVRFQIAAQVSLYCA